MTVLLSTVHGSRLYGLAHENSDHDIYEVIATKRTSRKRNIEQTIVNGIDKTVADMSTFMAMVDECIPQALETLWTPCPTVDKIHEFRMNYRVSQVKMKAVYLRTAKNFAEHDEYKRRRHALRLLINLLDAMRCGKFNPQLDIITRNSIEYMMRDEKSYEGYFNTLVRNVEKWV